MSHVVKVYLLLSINPCCGPFHQSQHAFVPSSIPSTIALLVVSINLLFVKHFVPPQAYIFISQLVSVKLWTGSDLGMSCVGRTEILRTFLPRPMSPIPCPFKSLPNLYLPSKRFQRAAYNLLCLVHPVLRLNCNSVMTSLEKKLVFTLGKHLMTKY